MIFRKARSIKNLEFLAIKIFFIFHIFIDIFLLQSTLPKVGKASQTTVSILGSIAKLQLYLSESVAILFWPDLTIVIWLKLFKKDGKASIKTCQARVLPWRASLTWMFLDSWILSKAGVVAAVSHRLSHCPVCLLGSPLSLSLSTPKLYDPRIDLLIKSLRFIQFLTAIVTHSVTLLYLNSRPLQQTSLRTVFSLKWGPFGIRPDPAVGKVSVNY